MTLMDDTGLVIHLHPIIETMISTLVKKQEGILKLRKGFVYLDYSSPDVVLKLFPPPLLTLHEKTKEKTEP